MKKQRLRVQFDLEPDHFRELNARAALRKKRHNEHAKDLLLDVLEDNSHLQLLTQIAASRDAVDDLAQQLKELRSDLATAIVVFLVKAAKMNVADAEREVRRIFQPAK